MEGGEELTAVRDEEDFLDGADALERILVVVRR